MPATEALYVDLASFGVHAPVDIQLYDNLGATHYHSPGLGGSKVHISLADVPAGIYYLQATQGVVRKVKRVIRK